MQGPLASSRPVFLQGVRGEFFRYVLASLVALTVDMALLLALARVSHYLVAASVGFVAGVAVNYRLATGFVFLRRRFAARRGWEGSLFLLVGVIGLALNDLAIYLAVESLALELAPAKLAAAGLTFLFNFAARKALIF